MTSEIRANKQTNRVGLGTVSFTNTGIVVSGIVTANSFSGPYNGTDIVGTGLTLTSTDTGSSAGPELKLFRNSASPADADYLGQLKFAGESDTGVERNYAKITGKILDASNGTEDGILEFAHIKGGSQTITGRWRSDSLQLLNDTNLSVAGDTTLTSDLDVDGHTNLDNVSIAGVTTAAGSIVQTSGFTQLRSFSNPSSGAGMELGYDSANRGVIQVYDRDNSVNRNLYIGGGNVGINQLNPAARLDVNGGFKVSGNIDANGDLDVDGHTNLDNTSIAGIVTAQQIRYSSGGGNWNGHPRSVVLGYSGSEYAGLGMGWIPTGTNGQHTSANTDRQSRLQLFDGLQIYGSGASVTSGQTVTWKTVADFKPAAIKLYTSGSSNSEKLRITSGGNVNIGGDYTQTTYPLSVLGSTGGNTNINIVQRLKYSGDSNQYNTGTVIAFTNTNTNANAYSYIGARIDSGSSGANANALVFATNATNTAPTEKLRITSSGKLCMAGSTGQYTLNNTSTDIIIGSGGTGRGITFHTSAYADNMTISFHANENLSRAEGEIKYGPPLTTTTADRNAMMFRTNSSERLRIDSNGRVSISSDGTIDGILTIKGNTDATSTPSIRLLDGSDTREVSITNTSGDFIASTHGTDNVAHGSLKVYDSGIIAFSTNSGAGNAERLRVDLNGGVRHMGTAGYWQITVIHNGSGSGNWYSGSAPQRIFPNYIDNRTGYAEFYMTFHPSTSYSGYGEPTFIITGESYLSTGGKIELNYNDRTNSPNNGDFRCYHGEYSWQIYNDGDTDQTGGQREINRNVEHRSSYWIDPSTQSVDYIASNDGRYGTNTEPIMDQRSYIKIKMNSSSNTSRAIQNHTVFVKFTTYTQGDKTWQAYMQYN